MDPDEDNSLNTKSDFFIIEKLGEKVLICECLETCFKILLFDLEKDPSRERAAVYRRWYNVGYFL